MWGDQWVCGCGWSNMVVRSKCRNCHEPRKESARMETPFEIIRNVERRHNEDVLVNSNALDAEYGPRLEK